MKNSKIKYRRLAIFSVLLNILLILFFVGKKLYHLNTKKEDSKWADIYNNDRADLFSQLPIDSTDIVFVGNSLTERFPLTELFHSLKIKNRGIGWNETSQVIGRIGSIVKHHPKKIFLEIGVNDIASHISIDSILNNYKKIIEIIETGSPKTDIVIQLLSPTCKDQSIFNPGIIALNNKLIIYAAEQHIKTLDLYTPLYKDGGLDTSLTNDGIHLKLRGYEIWKNKIDSLVNL